MHAQKLEDHEIRINADHNEPCNETQLSAKLERRRRIEDLYEAKRLQS